MFLGITVKLFNYEGDEPRELGNAIRSIKEGLDKPYLKKDSKEMDEDCKGLKEIRLSAAWMRGKELDSEIPVKEPPAVAIRRNGNNLQYII